MTAVETKVIEAKPAAPARKPAAKAQNKSKPSIAGKVAVKAPAVAAKKSAAKTKPAGKTVVKPVIKTTPKAAPKTPAVKLPKPAKAKKVKMVRDSFTMPKPEFAVFDELKLRAAKLATPIKKTELIRAGIKALAAMPDASFLAAVKAVPNLKTGRPAKS